MNLKKFISSVSAIAIAASAFAAMAVTASAVDYDNVAVTPGTTWRVTDNGGGTYTTLNNSSSGYSGVIADLSGLPDIDNATSVTVEFDTYVKAAKGATAKLMYGVGDKRSRGLTAYTFSNHIGQYTSNATGLATYFGSEDGATYKVRGKGTNYANYVANQTVHAKVELDRENNSCKTTLTVPGNAVDSTVSTPDGLNLTVIEAVTWGAPSYEWLTLKDIKVSYTVPDAPTPIVVDVTNQQAVTGSDGTATIVKTSYDGDGTIDTLTITATPVGGVEDTKTFERVKDYEFDTVFSGAAVEFSVFVKGVESVSAIAIN